MNTTHKHNIERIFKNSLTFLLVVMLGCTGDTDYETLSALPYSSTEMLLSNDVLVKSSLLGNPYSVKEIKNDHLLIYDRDNKSFLSVYNIEKDSIVSRLLSSGKGANELLNISIPSLASLNDTIHFFSTTTKKYYSIPQSHIISHDLDLLETYVSNKNNELKDIYDVYRLRNKYVTTGSFDNGAFSMFNEDWRKLKEVGVYPENSINTDIPNSYKQQLYSYVLNTDGRSRFVVASHLSDILKIYDVDGYLNNVKLIKSYELNLPLAAKMANFARDMKGVVHSRDHMNTVRSISVNDDFIYVLYRNENGNKPFDSDSPKLYGNEILVFNWLGHPIKKYILDRWSAHINVNETNDHILSICLNIDNEPEIVKYRAL